MSGNFHYTPKRCYLRSLSRTTLPRICLHKHYYNYCVILISITLLLFLVFVYECVSVFVAKCGANNLILLCANQIWIIEISIKTKNWEKKNTRLEKMAFFNNNKIRVVYVNSHLDWFFFISSVVAAYWIDFCRNAQTNLIPRISVRLLKKPNFQTRRRN